MTDVLFHPDAVLEARAAHDWYAERSAVAAEAFLAELDDAVAQVTSHPKRWPGYLAETRRYLFKRFPFLLVYRERADAIEVIAVAHGRRRPGYWRDR